MGDAAAEIGSLIEEIFEAQRRWTRPVVRYLKRSRKGREGVLKLEAFGLPIPDDFRDLYAHHDGLHPPPMPRHATQVFGEFEWYDTRCLELANTMSRARSANPLTDTFHAFRSGSVLSLDLAPGLAENGKCPLVANMTALSPRRFIAFDSTLHMLRTMAAAHREGVFRYDDDQLVFDRRAFAEVARAINRRDVFWMPYAEGLIDWGEPPPRTHPGTFSDSEKAVFARLLGPSGKTR